MSLNQRKIVERKSFDNLLIGPVVSIPRLEMKQEILQEMLDRGLVVTSYITDVNHSVFKQFSNAKKEDKPVAVFITVEYKFHYD